METINNNKVNYTNTPPLTIESGERRVNWKGRWKAGWYLSMNCCARNFFDYLVDQCYGSEIDGQDTLDYFNMISFTDNKNYLTEEIVFERLNKIIHFKDFVLQNKIKSLCIIILIEEIIRFIYIVMYS